MEVKLFKSGDEFREWLEENHNKAREIWVGYYKKNSGKTGITWQESIDQALCYGWIDSIVKKIDEDTYANRFTPRRSGSAWSQINIKRFKELRTLNLVKRPGLQAFSQREGKKSRISS
jgi:uncharacterized protein YdeI (YjbR/CyaY-like superfamily)